MCVDRYEFNSFNWYGVFCDVLRYKMLSLDGYILGPSLKLTTIALEFLYKITA